MVVVVLEGRCSHAPSQKSAGGFGPPLSLLAFALLLVLLTCITSLELGVFCSPHRPVSGSHQAGLHPQVPESTGLECDPCLWSGTAKNGKPTTKLRIECRTSKFVLFTNATQMLRHIISVTAAPHRRTLIHC